MTLVICLPVQSLSAVTSVSSSKCSLRTRIQHSYRRPACHTPLVGVSSLFAELDLEPQECQGQADSSYLSPNKVANFILMRGH